VSELSPDLIRRVLVATQDDNIDELRWHTDPDGTLRFFVDCSDWFEWGTADVEPVETAEDVVLLEACLTDLQAATGCDDPPQLAALYASRRRGEVLARWFLNPDSKYYIGDAAARVFTADLTQG
jgi:hypothetical protein